MTDRSLTAAAITNLESPEAEFYKLVRMDLASPIYYTTATYEIVYGGNTYLPNPTLKDIPDFSETIRMRPATQKITFSGVLLSAQALTQGSYKNKDVYVYEYYPVDASAIELFTGTLDSYSSTDDKITWSVANHWSNFDERRGRILTDEYQQRLFPGDRGLEFISKTAPALDYWGKYKIGTSYSQSQGRFVSNTLIPVASPTARVRDSSREILGSDGGFTFSDTFEDTKKTVNSAFLPVYYGTTIAGGMPCFRFVSGANSEFLHVVYIVGEGQVNYFSDVTFNFGDEVRSYTDGSISAKVTAYFHQGIDSAVVDAALQTATSTYGSGEWSVNHRLRGIAYVHMVYEYDEEIWDGEPLPIFHFTGRKPDTTTTSGIYNDNPAWVVYDYLTNTTFGKGIPSAELDAASFVTAAAYCAALVVKDDSGPGTISRFAFGGGISTKETLKANLDTVLATMRGFLVKVGGTYRIIQERHDESSVYSFDESNYKAKSLKVKDGGLSKLANVVYYTYSDEDNDGENDTVISDSAAYLAEDGGTEFRMDIESLLEKSRSRARNKADTALKRSREQIQIELIASHADARRIESGKIIDLSNSTRSWSAKLFRVVETVIMNDGDVKLYCWEYEPTVFDWSVPAVYILPNSVATIDHFTVTPPSALTVASGTAHLLLGGDGTVTSRAYVSFTLAASIFVHGYELEYKKTTESTYTKVPMPGPDNDSVYLSPMEDGTNYNIRVRSGNGLGRYSAWVAVIHTVAGKLLSPNPPSALASAPDENANNLTWTNPSDVDLSHTEIWASTTNNRSLAVLVGSEDKTFNHSTSTAQYYWIRSIDTTGLFSTWHPTGASSGVLGTPDAIPGLGDITLDQFGGDGINIMNEPFSSFEDGTSTNSTNADWDTDNTHQRFGSKCAKVTLVATGSGLVWLVEGGVGSQQPIKYPDAGGLILSFYAEASNSGMTARISLESETSPAYQSITTGSMNRYEFLIPSVTDVESYATLDITGNAGETVYFDGIQIERKLGTLNTSTPYTLPIFNWQELTDYRATLGATWGTSGNIGGDRFPDYWDNDGLVYHNYIEAISSWNLTAGLSISNGEILVQGRTAGNSIGFRLMKHYSNLLTFSKRRSCRMSLSVDNVSDYSTTLYFVVGAGGGDISANFVGVGLKRIGSTLQVYLVSCNGTTTTYTTVTGCTLADNDYISAAIVGVAAGGYSTLAILKNGTTTYSSNTTSTLPTGTTYAEWFGYLRMPSTAAGTAICKVGDFFTMQEES